MVFYYSKAGKGFVASENFFIQLTFDGFQRFGERFPVVHFQTGQ